MLTWLLKTYSNHSRVILKRYSLNAQKISKRKGYRKEYDYKKECKRGTKTVKKTKYIRNTCKSDVQTCRNPCKRHKTNVKGVKVIYVYKIISSLGMKGF